MTGPRVRFAPSPTGFLHIGGARTALYTWLWAKKVKGTFVLRVEDTDLARSTDESVQAILTAMKWMELDWDEGPEVGGDYGPYYQSKRLSMYRAFADQMVENGSAYRCYATAEELDRARREYEEKTGKKGFKYPGWWREKTSADWPKEGPYVYRLKVPEGGSTAWDDLVKGRIEIQHSEMQDAVIMRANGVPLYNFGCVVDDMSMKIDLVSRGDDHILNTPVQILIYQGLGAKVPDFAHLPMILDENGKKMSKRKGAGSVEAYRERGFVPDAVINYLARLGWSHGDQELFERDELIELFDWKNCGREASRYDEKKFEHVQAHHLRKTPVETLTKRALPFVKERGLDVDENDARYPAAVQVVLQRATTLIDIADMVDYFFREPPEVDEKAAKKYLKPKFIEAVASFRELIASTDTFDRKTLEQAISSWMEEKALGFKHYAQAVRVSVSGRSATPGLYETLEVLGKERTLTRLDRGLEAMKARADEAS